MNQNRSRTAHAATAIAIAIGVAAAMLPSVSLADNICFNQFGHPALPGPPPIPGAYDDPHWSTVYRFDYHNGTPVADGTLQVGSDSGNLYFEWVIHNATGFSNSDRVILAFQDSLGAYRMIAIQPNCDGLGVTQHCDTSNVPTCDPLLPACTTTNTQPSFSPTYYTGTLSGASVTWGGASSLPAGITIAAGSTGTGQMGSSNDWYVQLKMPAVNSASGGYTINNTAWKLYSDVFHVDLTVGPPTVTELTWPNNAGNVVYVSSLNLPPVANWGNAAIGAGSCVGMHVTRAYTNGTNMGNPDPLMINYDRADMQISADTVNTGPVDGTCVAASFRVANFGATNAWKLVPAPNNPSAALSIAKNGGTRTFNVGPWNVPADPDVSTYLPTGHPHQCIRVDLNIDTSSCVPGLGGNTLDTATFFQNMDFGHSSVFTREPAEISGDLGPPPSGSSTNKYELFVVGKPSLTKEAAILTLMVHGARHTGNYVDLPTGKWKIVNDRRVPETQRFEVTMGIPSFGYVIEHQLSGSQLEGLAKASPAQQLSAWAIDLIGVQPRRAPGTDKQIPGLYTIEVPVKGVARVTPTVEYTGLGGGGGGGGGPPPCCLSTMPKKGTTPVAAGGLFLIGVLAYGLHRRRRR